MRLVMEPTVVVLADMKLRLDGLDSLVAWLADYAPQCLDPAEESEWAIHRLLPHAGHRSGDPNGDEFDDLLTDNEALVELAGRKCYNSFGRKAGQKTNADYIRNTQQGDIPHASIMYHAKMSFFIGGVSRRVSHELIRNYVGADRTEEGAPSQESTRYTHHPGHFVVHPRVLASGFEAIEDFKQSMKRAYDDYLGFIEGEVAAYQRVHDGAEPKGMDRKRIYEAAAQLLPSAAATSFVWTTNPVALRKLFRERCDVAADLEFQRFAKVWRSICLKEWPNLFPGMEG